MKIDFRKINKDDYNFLWKLNVDLFKNYVIQIWGWDEEWQRKHFDNNFDVGNGNIIVFENQDIGLLRIVENPEFTFIASILIIDKFQNRGIGTHIICELIESAKKPIELRVLNLNPARKLYERLGFIVRSKTETHTNMRFDKKIKSNDYFIKR